MRSTKAIRAAKLAYIIMSALFCMGGVLLIVYRNVSVSVIGVAAGVMLILFGIVKLIGYFSRDLYRLAFQFDLAFGSLLILLGTVILTNPVDAMSFFCLVTGIVIMAEGLFKAQMSIDARRFGLAQWWVILTLSMCAVAVGALLAFRPTQSVGMLTALMGLSFLFEGALNLCVALLAVKIVAHQHPDTPEDGKLYMQGKVE
ncbi:MAG: DUF308 domain-containing protein [Clostridiales bacterium]|nr:DUF308 domain-containing protein [Clostridiales bacterium]